MSVDSLDESVEVLQQVVSIVSAYVSHNAMRAVELPEFIGAVHASLRQLSKEQVAAEAKPPESPAVPVKRSVSKEFIVCLECGKKFKSLRRHLSSFHSLTPDEYRAKWSLPGEYPMVAPAYSATRSQLARDSGLGQVSRNGEAAEARPAEEAGKEADKSKGKEAETHAAEPAQPAVAASEPEGAAATPTEAAVAEGDAEPVAAEAPPKPKRGRPKKVAA